MCNVILTEELAKQIDFIAYNIAFSKETKKFTFQEMYDTLNQLKLDVTPGKVESIIDSWLNNDLIFENLGSYIIYS